MPDRGGEVSAELIGGNSKSVAIVCSNNHGWLLLSHESRLRAPVKHTLLRDDGLSAKTPALFPSTRLVKTLEGAHQFDLKRHLHKA